MKEISCNNNMTLCSNKRRKLKASGGSNERQKRGRGKGKKSLKEKDEAENIAQKHKQLSKNYTRLF
jgi:hypothetical protein